MEHWGPGVCEWRGEKYILSLQAVAKTARPDSDLKTAKLKIKKHAKNILIGYTSF